MQNDFSVVVPVRSGSERVKNKNFKTFYSSAFGVNFSLLSWKLNQLSKIFLKNNIIVSSDSELAFDISRDFGVRFVPRPSNLALSDTPFHEMIKYSTSLVNTRYMVWAPVTSPFFSPLEMKQYVNEFIKLSEVDKNSGLIAASEETSYFLLESEPVNFGLGPLHPRTQDMKPFQKWDWAFSIRNLNAVKSNSYMIGESPIVKVISQFSNFDIDDELDFKMAQCLIDLYLELNSGENSFEL